MSLQNPYFKWENGIFVTINQKELPLKENYIGLKKLDDYFEAIRELKVRGAPAIGVTALFAVASYIYSETDKEKIKEKALFAIEKLKTARPTAVNIFNALEALKEKLESETSLNADELRELIEKEAVDLMEYEKMTCLKMAEYGQQFIKSGMNVLTQCNTGMLATPGIGTALGVIFKAFENKTAFHVYVPETRPLLQGGRLTVYELEKMNIPYTLITDNMRGHLFSNRKIDIVMVGADRIALNGDTANKIGTFESAFLAFHHKVPFHVVAPTTTFDKKINSGKNIEIELRKNEEVTHIGACKISTAKNVYNPAFDVTPAEYITSIITEKGVVKGEVECIKQLLF
ncbi:TPA: S-methyl-5-thioribose-1-phosphate isomerase [candidate division WOR-3 bacterium]|jgi:methylthioribose-1-phosphate isomerase|uniref:S-methyl-5-thioribose-1-phosphate isomerase n=1 Tax=candidate division WOR-3 bacterium TaxID=2052148 RepID=A0A350H9W2_UNCW3|nr:S-methyl-5-thioribose-1-phosphate isomerase [candidate division WOR-3 bacterium]